MVRRERQRYIIFKIIKNKEDQFNQEIFIKELWNNIWTYFGLREANKIGLWVLDWNLEMDYGILRCSHESKEIIISALTLIKEIEGERVIFSPIKTSGTIRALKNKYLKKLIKE